MYDEWKNYLPKFISASSEKELISELKEFPHNLDSRFYSTVAFSENTFLQGDGISSAKICDLKSEKFRNSPCMIISNSCDISPENERLYPTSVCYVPLLSFEKVLSSLYAAGIDKSKITNWENDVRKQRISSIVFLSKGQNLSEEKIAFLDRVQNLPATTFHETIVQSDKIFSLSNFGFYLLVLKLSIHFTRIRDGVDRFVA